MFCENDAIWGGPIVPAIDCICGAPDVTVDSAWLVEMDMFENDAFKLDASGDIVVDGCPEREVTVLFLENNNNSISYTNYWKPYHDCNK